ncbi:MAG TPA: acyl-CoA dehydrogenase family protein [Dehalococcoidia bacterium]|nr:acyl-CoA dehydrogenase family protein [Dehalococcoidia bacterium]
MTTETRPATTDGIDYAQYESAIGLNWYEADPNLQFLVERLAEPGDREFVERHLRSMGAVMGGPIAARAEVTDKNPPRLEKYDRWGNEVNAVVHHQSALDTKRDLWENGFIGLRWTEEVRRMRAGRLPPVLSTAFSYFLSQAETGMLCAIGMTSSAAGIIDRHAPPEVRDRFLPHLTTMDFGEAWDGAMFMTEIKGGSDLASSECGATKTADGWRVNGSKWFCSNVDAEAILTLARPAGADAGLRGLALFLVPKRRADGSRNGIHIRRLKDKLGTKAVPTGEVDFEDAEAYLMGAERTDDDTGARDGRGLNRMMEMVQGSRFGVALMGLGIMRRSFLESAIYAFRRNAFGRPIADYPLMRETLFDMAVEVEAGCAIAFEAAEAGAKADAESRRLYRILVPLAKFRCARRGVELASQAVEVFGGNGYIENWPVARQLRDAQCHTIWEGTENIICLDVLRSMTKEHAEEALFARIERALAGTEHPSLSGAVTQVGRAADEVRDAVAYLERAPQEVRLLQARRLTDYMADVMQAALLIEEAQWELAYKDSARKAVVARRFVQKRLASQPVRGITSGDTLVLDYFDPVVRYQPIAKDAIVG